MMTGLSSGNVPFCHIERGGIRHDASQFADGFDALNMERVLTFKFIPAAHQEQNGFCTIRNAWPLRATVYKLLCTPPSQYVGA